MNQSILNPKASREASLRPAHGDPGAAPQNQELRISLAEGLAHQTQTLTPASVPLTPALTPLAPAVTPLAPAVTPLTLALAHLAHLALGMAHSATQGPAMATPGPVLTSAQDPALSLASVSQAAQAMAGTRLTPAPAARLPLTTRSLRSSRTLRKGRR